MSSKDIKGFAPAGNAAVLRPGGGGWRRPASGHLARLLRALGWTPRAEVPWQVRVPETAVEEAAPLLLEKHFATEPEAEGYARDMAARGYHVQVQHNVYDYGWSVEVHATGSIAGALTD